MKNYEETRMLIIQDTATNLTLREKGDFFGRKYKFGKSRIARIWKDSELSLAAFAKENNIHEIDLQRWLKGRPNNPCPEMRLKLAFIEAAQQKKKNQKRA
jgi:hypothetical protein